MAMSTPIIQMATGSSGAHDWDPEQLSLGLVASGTVDIKGQEVDANAKLATGPAAGATEIVLDLDIAEASGWAALASRS